ncbi:MAG TPA: glycerol-3-phosphate 1-O-acyltransferase PlsY [Polyangia bacterium]|jgi:glycerol-3-phosphate acyltransferase PlsY
MRNAVLICLGAYVLGSIPTGLLVARARGVDIRKVGSGNIGATNVARALGKRWAIFVLVCDALKGFIPVAVAKAMPGTSPTVVALAGLATIVGHMFTIFLRGRGGKGVATSLGVSLGLSPPIGLGCLGVYAAAYALTRLSSLGSLLGIWSFPVIAALHGGVAREYIALSVVVALLVTLRHRDNIRRLVRREEKRA